MSTIGGSFSDPMLRLAAMQLECDGKMYAADKQAQQAERAARRAENEKAVEEMRDKADQMESGAQTSFAIGMAGTMLQMGSAVVSIDGASDASKLSGEEAQEVKDKAAGNAKLLDAFGGGFDRASGYAKQMSDSRAAGHDAEAASHRNQAEEHSWAADDAGERASKADRAAQQRLEALRSTLDARRETMSAILSKV